MVCYIMVFFRSIAESEAAVERDRQRTKTPAEYKREKEFANRTINAIKQKAAQVAPMGASIAAPIMRINRPPKKLMVAAPAPTSVEKMVM